MKTDNSRIKVVETMLVLLTASVVAYLVTHRIYFLYTGLAIGIIALFSKTISLWIHIGWMKLAAIMGLLSNTLFLTTIFFLILSPMALLRRLFQKKSSFYSPLQVDSNFEIHSKTFQPNDLENMW